ncbi:cell division protein ZapA [Thiococcus pfennigii]|jgi:cell division protein ZapA|uniref:cell division protein ZapA n=1 Tax=Thiococcus pfennigii TaxID=1057 RepID=UPI001906729D|nr:cell division protein ZapA [Thiococcus pfennigii]MBK1700946.1 cell division protein ZapA [Thiococcus pfennigii]MBK1731949.1 cell division protein ZapA [Thiococcus pfennigii]
MSSEAVPITVRILDKEYHVGCQPDEQDELYASARLLDERMREIRRSGRVIGTDRIAVMAALNIAHELILQRKAEAGAGNGTAKRLLMLQERIEAALAGRTAVDGRDETV